MVAQGQRTLTDLFDYVRNLLDSSKWVVGTSGSQPGFTRYGADANNFIELGIDPFGRSNPVWKYLDTDAAVTNTDGGFTTAQVAVNPAYTYRFILFLKRSSATDGISYLGMYSNGSAHVLTLAGADNTNPYFWNGDLPVADRWYAIISYVHGQNTAVVSSIGGVYDTVTGVKVASCTDFKWKPGTSQAQMRTYLLSSTVLGNAAWAWNPIIEICDGGEQPIETLFAGKASDFQLTQMASDGIITPQEKTLVLGRWCEIVNDVARTTAIPTAYNGTIGDGRFKTLRDRAYGLGIWTPTTASTAAKNFYDAAEGLRAYLFGTPGVILSTSWASNITITKTTWLTLWMTFESTADALQTAITTAAQAQSVVFLTSLATAGNYTGQLGVFRGQIYRWTGSAWENQDASLPTDIPAFYLSFEDIVENKAIDNSGKYRHGTISGAVVTDGVSGKGLFLNGTSDYVIPTPCWQNATEFSFSCWARRDAYNQYQSLFSDYESGNRNILCGYENPSGTLTFYCGSGITTRAISTPANSMDGSLHHWVFMFKGSTFMRIYRDGEKVAEGTTTIPASVAAVYSASYRIGSYASGYFFQGMIDEPIMYLRAISESEVRGLYLTKAIPRHYTKSEYMLDLMADDSVITKAEKIAKLPDWCAIIDNSDMSSAVPSAYDGTVAQGRFKTLRDAAHAVGVWTPGTASTPSKDFYDAVEALRFYLFGTPGVFAVATWDASITIVPATWRSVWSAVSRTADALQSRIAEAQPHGYLGRFTTDHPTPRNHDDWWLIYSPAPMRGIYYDNAGTPTKIDGTTTDQRLLAKRAEAMQDVAWAEANGYGYSDDYGFQEIFRDIAVLRAVVKSLMAEDLVLLGQLRSGYDKDGGVLNKLTNSDWSQYGISGWMTGWTVSGVNNGFISSINATGWTLGNETSIISKNSNNTAWLSNTTWTGSPGTAPWSVLATHSTYYIPVLPGERYCASVYIGAHRSHGSVGIMAYDSSKNWVSAYFGKDNDAAGYMTTYPEGFTGGPTLEGYKRVRSVMTIPAGVAYIGIGLYKSDTYESGFTDSYTFFTRPMLEKVEAGIDDPSDWVRNNKGIFIDADGNVYGANCSFENGSFSGTIDATNGIFKGLLKSTLLDQQKGITARTLAPPTKTHWTMGDFNALFSCAAGSAYDTTGTYNGQSITKLGKFTTASYVKNGTTTIDTFGVFDFRNYAFSIYEPGSSTILRQSSSILNYWQGSAWINTLAASDLPQNIDIVISNSSFNGKTIQKLNFNLSRIILTASDSSTITIDPASYYSYTQTLAVPDQGAEKLVVNGTIDATVGTIKAEYYDGANYRGYIKCADHTLICYGSNETNNTTITFPHSFASAQYSFTSTIISSSNYVFSTQITARSASQVSINKRWMNGLSNGAATEPITYIAIGRW